MSKQPLESEVRSSVEKINDEVAVGEDLHFQERWWRFERAIWMFFSLVLIATLLGVFGRGPLASHRIRNDQMSIKFDRIARSGTPSLLEIELAPSAIHNGVVHLYVSESLVRELGAQRIIPQPAQSYVGDGGITYTFPTTGTPASIKFGLQPDGPGIYTMKIGTPGVPLLQCKIIVLP